MILNREIEHSLQECLNESINIRTKKQVKNGAIMICEFHQKTSELVKFLSSFSHVLLCQCKKNELMKTSAPIDKAD